MAEVIHEAAPHYLPFFIVAPGETDVLFVVIICVLLAIVLLAGNFYFKLHALPERMAHSAKSAQIQLVGVLALLALFTHNNVFWVAALVIAALRIPDFSTPLNSIARSLDDLSDRIDRNETFKAKEAPVSSQAPAATPNAEAPSTLGATDR